MKNISKNCRANGLAVNEYLIGQQRDKHTSGYLNKIKSLKKKEKKTDINKYAN